VNNGKATGQQNESLYDANDALVTGMWPTHKSLRVASPSPMHNELTPFCLLFWLVDLTQLAFYDAVSSGQDLLNLETWNLPSRD
jgi:hypothetical protein